MRVPGFGIRKFLRGDFIKYVVVSGANHSFYSIGWSEEICDKVKAWLIVSTPFYKPSSQRSKSDF